jgi:hypothetical protein
MDFGGATPRRCTARVLCGVVVACLGLAAWAVPLGHGPSLSTQDAQEAADLADASADLSALRALSAAPPRASADKPPTSTARAEPATAPSRAAAASTPAPPLTSRDGLRLASKELAESTGLADAKARLEGEFGADKTGLSEAEADADPANALRRRAAGTHGDTEPTPQGPQRTAEQIKNDGARASILASALINEVMPWAVGAALVLAGIKGVRLFLAFSRKQSKRQRRHRRSSGRSTRQHTRL